MLLNLGISSSQLSWSRQLHQRLLLRLAAHASPGHGPTLLSRKSDLETFESLVLGLSVMDVS